MSYDCIDGWSDITEALQLNLNREGIDADDPQEVATLALDRIAELQRIETAARAMFVALLEMQAALTEHKLRDVKSRFSLCLADAAASKALVAAEEAGVRI